MDSPRLSNLPAPLAARLRAVRLHQLEGFFHVGLAGGFTRATESMPYPISEPALHQQVRKLERALGVPLVVKGPGRRMLLTPEGRRLHGFVEGYFRGLPSLLAEVVGGRAGVIALGCEPLHEELAAGALTAVRRGAPGTRARLVQGDVSDLVEQVRQGELDAAIAGEAAPGEGVRFEPLGRLGLVLLLPAGHALAEKRALRVSDLEGLEVATYAAGTAARRWADEALRRAELHLRVVAEAPSAAALRALVRAGFAPAFVPALPRGRGRSRLAPGEPIPREVTALLAEAELPRFGLFSRAGPSTPLLLALLRALRSP